MVRTATALIAAAGIVCPSVAALAESARPADPSNWAKQVPVAEARAGTLSTIVSTVATTTEKGVADEIAENREQLGSSPNPPGRD